MTRISLHEYDYSRSEWEHFIRQWIFSEEARQMVALSLLDGYTYEQIAEKMFVSVDKVKKIVRKHKDYMLKHVDKYKI